MKITLGAEPKKMLFLGGLLLLAAWLLYTNFRGETPQPAPSTARVTAPAPAPRATAPAAPAAPAPDARRAPRTAERSAQEFRPSLKPKRPEERRDPATIDPALRLDLLAGLQKVKFEGGQRSLFEFGQPRPPKTPDVKILPKSAVPGAGAAAPSAQPPAAAAVKPPPPPITFKFFGFISPARGGAKRAFFLDGEDIFVAGEGEIMKKRYKVVRIGINSAVLEDVEFQHQQTVPMEEQPAG